MYLYKCILYIFFTKTDSSNTQKNDNHEFAWKDILGNLSIFHYNEHRFLVQKVSIFLNISINKLIHKSQKDKIVNPFNNKGVKG